jgi:hypothetical protein
MNEVAIRVIEILHDAPAEQIESLLNAPDHSSYYLHSIMGRFAVFQKRSDAVRAEIAAAKREAKQATLPECDGENARAEAFVRAHPQKTSRVVAEMLGRELGIVRSYKWVQRRRTSESGCKWLQRMRIQAQHTCKPHDSIVGYARK